MCDTLVYRSPTATYFAKNSDREPNEPQEILHLAAQKHTDTEVKCTFISIPQVAQTLEVILSKPFQMWGAEMGINECGVTIGNEAVFTNLKKSKNNEGLTGMDMIRLALERATTASEAVTLIGQLIETYGQDACGGYENKNFYYDNSFIIADANSAYKLESAGRNWALKSIHQYDAISNGLSIESDYDQLSPQCNLMPGESFRQTYRDTLYTSLSRCSSRRQNSLAFLSSLDNEPSVLDFIHYLQSHRSTSASFHPSQCDTSCICMHPTSVFNPSQTTGSMVAVLRPGNAPIIYLTGTSNPCLSIYKPLDFSGIIDSGDRPGPRLDASLWWQAERAHRTILQDPTIGRVIWDDTMSDLQQEILSNRYSKAESWSIYRDRLDQLNDNLSKATIKQKNINPMYRMTIRQLNRKVGL